MPSIDQISYQLGQMKSSIEALSARMETRQEEAAQQHTTIITKLDDCSMITAFSDSSCSYTI